MFKETLDSLNKIDIRGVPDSLQAEYYSLMGRYYYDLGDFDNDSYNTPDYNRKGNAYMDSALRLYPPGSFNHSYYTGLKEIKSNQRNRHLPSSGNCSAAPVLHSTSSPSPPPP